MIPAVHNGAMAQAFHWLNEVEFVERLDTHKSLQTRIAGLHHYGHRAAGGTGKADPYATPCLLKRGHDGLNLDLVQFAHAGVRTLITDSGQAFNMLSMRFDSSGLIPAQRHRCGR
ncbi:MULTISPECIES: hypothetical protein [Mesorhizobium]|uniref:hypothetical protein n=1 Tax=Mesorhizobium TaxID=68287 RepID=UPI0010A97ACD|nr:MULTISPECIES: hypothetical protein [Mesorhizobium]